MEGVEFEQDKENYNFIRATRVETGSSFTRFLLRKGLARDERQANAVLLICASIFIIITIILLIISRKSDLDNVIYDLPDNVIINLPEKAQNMIYDQKYQP